MKFGIYSDAGNLTCGGYPGSLGHEELDAQTFASWGIDYLKLDGCYVSEAHSGGLESAYRAIYSHWHEVLSALPNPLIFSESAPAYFSDGPNLTDWYTVMDWVPQYGDLARHSTDIPTFDDPAGWEGVMRNYEYEILLARYQRPGFFNDPDFLIVDHPSLTLDEKKSQFGLWVSFGAPLIISAWIPGLTADEIKYLTNENLIAVDQDPLGLQATLVSRDSTFDVLTKSLGNGDRLLTVLNRGPETANISVSLERVGYPANTSAMAKDLWTGEKKVVHRKVETSVVSHGTAVFRISTSREVVGSVVPTGLLFNTASRHCLTAGEALGWANCTGGDEQVWRVKRDGSIGALSSATKCLEGSKDGSVTLGACAPRVKGQSWTYEMTGNVKNGGNCLTEDGGKVSLKSCAFETNEQVFELPSGSLKR